MIRTLAVLCLLLLPAPSAMAQSWLNGTWIGTGYQTDDNSTWAMKLTITRLRNGGRQFSIDYPSLNCGGRWKLLKTSQRKFTFREQLSFGQERCANNGRVWLERVNRKQIVYWYSNQGSREITASAVLTRQRN